MVFPRTSPSLIRSRQRRALSCLLILAGIVFAGAGSQALVNQGRNSVGLISQAVNESDRVILSGNVSPQARRAADRGAVSPSTPADRMLLLLKRSADREDALRALIQSMHDKNSPNFHRWLTPAQFGAEWGAADSDIAAVTAWLESHGFSVQGPTAGRTAIEFSGTAGQVQEAFHTSIHLFELNGEMHHANVSDPQIPAALAPVIAGITTLNDFHPRSMARKGPRGIYNSTTHQVRPELTAAGSDYDFLYVGPSDAATIYNTPVPALNPAASGNAYDGTGVKIGILGDSNITPSQVTNYRALFGISKLFPHAATTPVVILDGSKNPGVNGDAVEAYLDTEVAGGIAPGAQVYLYTAADTAVDNGLNLATSRAVNDNLVDVLNVSFGECEGGLAYAGNQFFAAMWEQAAAQGISVTVSSGDSGSAGCDDPNSQTQAYYGLMVNGLASTPYNIAVGGTDFAALAGPDGSGANFTNYVTASNDPTTLRSAKQFIPEVPWNNTFSNFPPGVLANNSAAPDPYANIVAAGGGKSNCEEGFFNGSSFTCIIGYQKPSWQTGPGVPADMARDLPDVSMFAANGLYYAAWGICTDQDKDANGSSIQDCTPGSNGLPPDEFYLYGVGGTSAAAPAFAGVLALVKQATGERQGQANYVLYNLARTAPSSFHDVKTGNNAVPCAAGTPNCAKNSAGSNYLSGYNAAGGYDLATGLGSVNASALVANWISAGLLPTTTQLTLSPATIEHGQYVTANVTVTASSGSPTGNVSLTALANPPSLKLARSVGAYALDAAGTTGPTSINSLPGGSYNVVAAYGGSGEYAVSTSTRHSVVVTPENSTVQLLISSFNPVTNAKVNVTPYGYYLGLAARPCGVHSFLGGNDADICQDGIPTGSVTFKANASTVATVGLSSIGSAVANGYFLNAGSYTIAADYSGDNSFNPGVGQLPLVITKGVTQISMTASATSYSGQPLTFKVQLATDSAALAPTGMVAIENGTTILAEVPLQGLPGGSNLASGTATITTSNIPQGKHQLHAEYLGDVNYAASASNSILVTGKPYFTLADTTTKLSSEHSTGVATIATTSEGGYAGTINYTCALVSGSSTSASPECAMSPATETLTAGGQTFPVMLVFGIGSKLPPGITLGSNTEPHKGKWLAAGGTALACCLLFAVPARRRAWKSLLSLLLLVVVVSGMAACSTPDKRIAAGTYTFKVIGTDSTDKTNVSSATVTVRVL